MVQMLQDLHKMIKATWEQQSLQDREVLQEEYSKYNGRNNDAFRVAEIDSYRLHKFKDVFKQQKGSNTFSFNLDIDEN